MTVLRNKKKRLIFDANIFLTGVDFNLIDAIIYTTPKVIEEIRVDKYLDKNRNILNKIQAAIDSKKLIIRSPSHIFVKEIEKNAKLTGDFNILSYTDKELIALTLELRETSNENVIIYTNDYSMQNLCSELDVPFSSLNKNGIKSKIIWEVYCPYCEDIYKSEDLNNMCEKCGLKLKRRPKK